MALTLNLNILNGITHFFFHVVTTSFPLKNTGQITFSYEWVVLDSEGSLLSPHPSHLHLDDVGSVMSEGGEVIPFTITPTQGQIAPGQEATFTLRFSPLDVRDAEYRFKCK